MVINVRICLFRNIYSVWVGLCCKHCKTSPCCIIVDRTTQIESIRPFVILHISKNNKFIFYVLVTITRFNHTYLCMRLGKGEMGTFSNEPSALLIETEFPTKSLILGLRPSSGESYCIEHSFSSFALKEAVGQYHTTSCASWMAAIVLPSAFHWNDSIFLPTNLVKPTNYFVILKTLT